MIILSALIAHIGWHWMSERAEVLWRVPWPRPDPADVAVMALWLGLIVLAAGAIGFALRRVGLVRASGGQTVEAPP